MSSNTRDPKRTTQKILTALKQLLVKNGFAAVGINAIAREAGVDKVLIYRYFGGLQGLFKELALDVSFWPTIEQIVGMPTDIFSALPLKAQTKAVLSGYVRELRRRPITQEILRQELVERNVLVDALADFREAQGLEIATYIALNNSKDALDITAVGALLHAGMQYLVLRSKTVDNYLGINLHDDTGWQRLECALDTIINALFPESGNS